MDTSHLENIAEDQIAHVLQKHGFFVAKPKFDLSGTDLLAFLEMGDGVKFARIQCKGRTIDEGSSITVPRDYVSKGFVLFAYLINSNKKDWLYCFFPWDLASWPRNAQDEYSVSIPRDSHETKFDFAEVTPERLAALRVLIEQAEIHGEFRHLSIASLNLTLDDAVFTGSASSATPSGA